MTDVTSHNTCTSFARARPRGVLQTIASLVDLAQQRRTLATLDEFALRDIGVSRADALQEARRPFWDRP